MEIQDVDVACITETWLGPCVEQDALEITNFNSSIRKDRTNQEFNHYGCDAGEYRGVAVYSRQGIPI